MRARDPRGGHRLGLRDLPRVPRRGRPTRHRDQLRRVRGPHARPHVRDGRRRLRARGDRRRDRARCVRSWRTSIEGGALGFSSDRGGFHLGDGGRPVPSIVATQAETEALMRVTGEIGRGIVHIAPGENFAWVYEFQRSLGRTITWSSILTYPPEWKSRAPYREKAVLPPRGPRCGRRRVGAGHVPADPPGARDGRAHRVLFGPRVRAVRGRTARRAPHVLRRRRLAQRVSPRSSTAASG